VQGKAKKPAGGNKESRGANEEKEETEKDADTDVVNVCVLCIPTLLGKM